MTAQRINPSILSADFVNLQAELEAISTADLVHVDVMDNHFVPNLTMGPPIVERIQAVSPIPLDMHLMISDADRWAQGYAEQGVYSVTFHAEATEDPVKLARRIRDIGARAGIALKPGTDPGPYLELLPEFDQVLVMTVEPGFGGQKFLDLVLPKIRRTRALIARTGGDIWLQVDGGVSVETIERCAEAGADTFVAGSAVYSAENPDAMVVALREQAIAACAH